MNRDSQSNIQELENYRLIAEHSTDIISRLTPEGVYLYTSPACQTWLGYEPNVVGGTSIYDYLHADDLSKIQLLLAALAQRQRSGSVIHRIRANDGTYQWFETTAKSIGNGGPEPSKSTVPTGDPPSAKPSDVREIITKPSDVREIIAVSRNITRRKAAEDALRASEERFRTLVEQSPISIQVLDPTGKTLQINQAWMDLWGATMQDLETYNVLEDPQLKGLGITEELAKAFHGEFITLPAIKYVPEESIGRGRTRWVHARAYPVRDETGAVKNVVLMHEDITEKRNEEEEKQRLQIQFQQAQKLESLGILAGGIAHDFNNLLVGILGNAGLALMELPETSAARGTIEQIENAAIRAADLCRQLLAYSGKGRFVIEAVNLSSLVEEMAHLLQISINKRATLRFDLAKDPPIIEADATQMRQIVMNLITNASEAIGDSHGTITISTGTQYCDQTYLRGTHLDEDLPEGAYAYLEVTDNGCGMDLRTQEQIFDPFFTTKFTGRGLGLAAVQGIVRGHRGAIKVYSEPGRGTAFKLLLPAKLEETSPAPKTAKREKRETRSATILVVDDDPGVRSTARKTLEHAGLQVLEAEDGEDAIQIFKDHSNEIEVVVLDMTMPRLNGEETFRALRQIKSGVSVILSSGYNEQEATANFVGKGLAGFIQKPWLADQLLDHVLGCLATH